MLVQNKNFTTIWYDNESDQVKIIDQRLIPFELKIVELNTVEEVCFAIKEMQVFDSLKTTENDDIEFTNDVEVDDYVAQNTNTNTTSVAYTNLKTELNEREFDWDDI